MSKRKILLWSGVAAALLVVAGFVWVALTQWLGVIYLPGGSETVGNFTIKSYRTEGFGHTGTKLTLYYRGHKIGEYLNGLQPSPTDADRAVYSRYCADGMPGQECGLFYFDGHKQRNYKIDPDYKVALVSLYPEYVDKYHPWSADGRFVIIQDQYKLLLVDLETGAHTDFAERLDAQALQQPMPPTRFVQFAGWSPDLHKAAVLLFNDADSNPPVRHFVADLYTVELPSRELTYRCSYGPYQDTDLTYKWNRHGDGYKFEMNFRHPGVREYDRSTGGLCSPGLMPGVVYGGLTN